MGSMRAAGVTSASSCADSSTECNAWSRRWEAGKGRQLLKNNFMSEMVDRVIQVCSALCALSWHYRLCWCPTVLLRAVEGVICCPGTRGKPLSVMAAGLQASKLASSRRRARLVHVCTACLSRPELCCLASIHLCLSAGRALVQIFPLIHRRDLFSHLLHRLRVFEAVKTCCPSFCSTSCRVLEISCSCWGLPVAGPVQTKL